MNSKYDVPDNEILDELRRIKDEIGAEFDYDPRKMGEYFRNEQRISGRIYHELHRDGSRTLHQYGKEIAFVPAGVDYKEVLANLAAAK